MTVTRNPPTTTPAVDDEAAIVDLVARLSTRFADTRPDLVDDVVRAQYATLSGSPVRNYVALLVEHNARDELSGRSRRTA